MAEANPDACRVCGYDIGAWGGQVPMYVICGCCGVESGVDDDPPSAARAYLAEWLAAGAPWYDVEERPDGWDLVRQLDEAGMHDAVEWLESGGDLEFRRGRQRKPQFAVTPHWERRQRS